MNTKKIPEITVVITTRNRGDKLFSAIESIFSNDYENFKVVVVDQSTDDVTKKSVNNYINDKKLTYIMSDIPGCSRGRNVGIENSESELIAITDDDCVVPRNWLQSITEAFEIDERVGIVFGNVTPGEYDKSRGFIPTYIRENSYTAHSIKDKHNLEGISACMGLRKSMWEELNGFDHMLGVGAYFKSGEESDLTIRALLHGYSVYETPSVSLVHNGFRNWEEGFKLIESYWYGTGAMFAKHIKCGHFSIISVLTKLGIRWAFGSSRVIDSLGKQQHRMLRLYSFIKGFFSGLIMPVDKKKQLFVEMLGQ